MKRIKWRRKAFCQNCEMQWRLKKKDIQLAQGHEGSIVLYFFQCLKCMCTTKILANSIPRYIRDELKKSAEED